MIKIVCNTQKEKRDLIEASEYLAMKLASINSMKTGGKTTVLALLGFLTSLHKNPGDIEVLEEGLVIRRSRNYEPPKKFQRGVRKLHEIE